jgi:acyl carrier protein
MHVDKEAIKGQVANFLKIPANRMDDTMRLTSIVPDSFMLVELLIQLQEQYGMRLAQADLENISTVSDLTELIAARAQP